MSQTPPFDCFIYRNMEKRCFYMFRKGTACVLAALMVFGTVSVCSAAETDTGNRREVSRYEAEISPFYVVIKQINRTLSFSGNCAQCKVSINVLPGRADRITYTLVLERKSGSSYSPVKTWSNQTASVNSAGKATIQKEYNVSTRGTYRIRVSGTVYKGTGAVESFRNVVSSGVEY